MEELCIDEPHSWTVKLNGFTPGKRYRVYCEGMNAEVVADDNGTLCHAFVTGSPTVPHHESVWAELIGDAGA